MRHFGQIAHHHIASNILTQRHGQFGFGIGKHIGSENLVQQHFLAVFVGQLDAHGVFARNGFHHAHRLHRQRARQIFCQVHNLAAFHALGGDDFIARDDWPCGGGNHVHMDAELGKLGFNALARLAQLLFAGKYHVLVFGDFQAA